MTPKKRAAFMWKIIKSGRPASMVPWYLMTSYLYYVLDKSLLPDEDFDRLCHEMLAKHDEIDHPHKHLVTREDLQAGTGYAIQSYPEITKGAAERLAVEDGLFGKRKRRR